MKVIPHIKSRKLAKNEARVIVINQEAIEELLLENLLEHKSEYFDILPVADDEICLMHWDYNNKKLVYAVAPIAYCMGEKQINLEEIGKKMGVTTDSVFKPNRYRILTL